MRCSKILSFFLIELARALLAPSGARMLVERSSRMLVRLLLTLRCVTAMLVQGPTAAISDLGFGLLPAAAVPKVIVDDARAAVAERLCELLDAADE